MIFISGCSKSSLARSIVYDYFFLTVFVRENTVLVMGENDQLDYDRPYERHGNKYVVTSPGCYLKYENMQDTKNESGRMLQIRQKDPLTGVCVQTDIQFYDGVPNMPWQRPEIHFPRCLRQWMMIICVSVQPMSGMCQTA